MSIKIKTPDGRAIWDDDVSVAMNRATGTIPVESVLDHLELLAQVPAMAGEGTSAAARAALNLIAELVDIAGDDGEMLLVGTMTYR